MRNIIYISSLQRSYHFNIPASYIFFHRTWQKCNYVVYVVLSSVLMYYRLFYLCFNPARWSEIILQQYTYRLGIDYTTIYLERFFRNLLLGDKWELRNRYLYVNAFEEWKVQPLHPLAISRFPIVTHGRNTC